MDAAWLEIPVWSVGGRSLSKQSRRIISRIISPVNRTEKNYIRGTVFSKYTVEIDSNEREKKKKFIETCRTAKSGHHCFPSLFPRNVSCVRCTLPLAFILVVSGLLMHYSILYFAFCATSRIRVSNAWGGGDFNKCVAKRGWLNRIYWPVSSWFIRYYVLLQYLALEAFWEKNALHFANVITIYV